MFRHRGDTTEGLPIKEYYAPEYPPLERAYEAGRRLLGDGESLAEAYAEMGTWKRVRWALQQAGELSPERSVFEEVVADVKAMAKEEDVSLTPVPSDSARTGASSPPADSTSARQ